MPDKKLYWILVRRCGKPTQVLWRHGIATARADMERLLFDDDVLAVRLCEEVACLGMETQ